MLSDLSHNIQVTQNPRSTSKESIQSGHRPSNDYFRKVTGVRHAMTRIDLEAKKSFALGKLPVDFAVNPKRVIEKEEIFTTLALEVRPPAHPITLDVYPQDRIQSFEKRAMQFQADKAMLIKKFPLQFDLPGKDVKKWCKVCLGSEMYNKIYIEPCNEEVEACLPSLSIVSHLQQHMVKSLLKYTCRWFLAINMHESIARWVFSLLMCLERPVDAKFQKFLGVFKNAMRKRLRACDECEGKQLNMMLAILDLSFIG
ncbi:gem-associated protein 2 [Trichonephila inaurata madagascariensis]|uniref:Gem-associated protein 2 n=1 Tax=Trichonephila inaurata madagascariensis TaxID=2747483 RepID=A0A8X7CPE2_9ARAC|nr:gem-associated protein 2 [Trichonephila inaurata madagascariensis]